MCDLPFLALILTKRTLFKSLSWRIKTACFVGYLLLVTGTELIRLNKEEKQLPVSVHVNALVQKNPPAFKQEFNGCPHIPKQIKIYDRLYYKPLTLTWFWFKVSLKTHLSVSEVAGHILYLLHQCAARDKPNSNVKIAAALKSLVAGCVSDGCLYLCSTNRGEYKLVSSGRGLMRAGLNSVISSEGRTSNEKEQGIFKCDSTGF